MAQNILERSSWVLPYVDGYNFVTNVAPRAGRLASVDGPLPNDTITYKFDELGRVTNRGIDSVAQHALGRVTMVTNVLGSLREHGVPVEFGGVSERAEFGFHLSGEYEPSAAARDQAFDQCVERLLAEEDLQARRYRQQSTMGLKWIAQQLQVGSLDLRLEPPSGQDGLKLCQ